METLLGQLQDSVASEYDWIASETMISLYEIPSTEDPKYCYVYDLSTLIGHKRNKDNMNFNISKVCIFILLITCINSDTN